MKKLIESAVLFFEFVFIFFIILIVLKKYGFISLEYFVICGVGMSIMIYRLYYALSNTGVKGGNKN